MKSCGRALFENAESVGAGVEHRGLTTEEVDALLVSILPGCDRQDVATSLQTAEFAANDARNTQGGIPLVSAYIAWVDEAVRQLRTRVSTADVERLVLTKRCWMLQPMVGDTSPLILGLIQAELDERVSELGAAHASLREQITRWSRPGAFVVADTSVYIEAPTKLEDLDFAPLVKVRHEPVHLLVPIVIVDELDGLKRSSDKRVRWRAGYTLAVLDRVFATTAGPARLRAEDFSALQTGGIPRGEVTIEFVLDPPGHQRLSINDDEIVDRTLAVQALAGRPVTLLTYDTGLSLRARPTALQEVKLSKPLESEPPG